MGCWHCRQRISPVNYGTGPIVLLVFKSESCPEIHHAVGTKVIKEEGEKKIYIYMYKFLFQSIIVKSIYVARKWK